MEKNERLSYKKIFALQRRLGGNIKSATPSRKRSYKSLPKLNESKENIIPKKRFLLSGSDQIVQTPRFVCSRDGDRPRASIHKHRRVRSNPVTPSEKVIFSNVKRRAALQGDVKITVSRPDRAEKAPKKSRGMFFIQPSYGVKNSSHNNSSLLDSSDNLAICNSYDQGRMHRVSQSFGEDPLNLTFANQAKERTDFTRKRLISKLRSNNAPSEEISREVKSKQNAKASVLGSPSLSFKKKSPNQPPNKNDAILELLNKQLKEKKRKLNERLLQNFADIIEKQEDGYQKQKKRAASPQFFLTKKRKG